MKTYTVTIVRSETWTVDIKAKSKHFAEQKARAADDQEIIAAGGSVEVTDLWIGVEEKK